MRWIKYMCCVLLLSVDICSGNFKGRIKSLDRKFTNQITSLRSNLENTRIGFRDEILDNEEKIKSDLKHDLPEMIETALLELAGSGHMEKILKVLTSRDTTLQKHVNQMKVQIRRKLEAYKTRQSALEEETMRLHESFEKIQKENVALKNEMVENRCDCVQNVASNTTAVKFTRVLAVGYDGNFYYFIRNNYTKGTYPIQSKNVTCVVYDPDTRNIIWSTGEDGPGGDAMQSHGVFSVSIDGSYVFPLVVRLNCYSLAVDNGLLFFGTTETNRREKRNTIKKFTFSNKKYITVVDVTKYGLYGYSLTIDARRRHIYSSCTRDVIRMDYDGGNIQVILKMGRASITFVPSLDVLYFSDRHRIKRLFSTSSVPDTMYTLVDNPRSMVYSGGILYTGDLRREHIRYINTYTNEIGTLGSIGSHPVSVCMIP